MERRVVLVGEGDRFVDRSVRALASVGRDENVIVHTATFVDVTYNHRASRGTAADVEDDRPADVQLALESAAR
ncbi:hypothetical protein GCM10028856_20460 [Halopiger thermotolerans]